MAPSYKAIIEVSGVGWFIEKTVPLTSNQEVLI